jgi:hypothetical protein
MKDKASSAEEAGSGALATVVLSTAKSAAVDDSVKLLNMPDAKAISPSGKGSLRGIDRFVSPFQPGRR